MCENQNEGTLLEAAHAVMEQLAQTKAPMTSPCPHNKKVQITVSKNGNPEKAELVSCPALNKFRSGGKDCRAGCLRLFQMSLGCGFTGEGQAP